MRSGSIGFMIRMRVGAPPRRAAPSFALRGLVRTRRPPRRVRPCCLRRSIGHARRDEDLLAQLRGQPAGKALLALIGGDVRAHGQAAVRNHHLAAYRHRRSDPAARTLVEVPKLEGEAGQPAVERRDASREAVEPRLRDRREAPHRGPHVRDQSGCRHRLPAERAVLVDRDDIDRPDLRNCAGVDIADPDRRSLGAQSYLVLGRGARIGTERDRARPVGAGSGPESYRCVAGCNRIVPDRGGAATGPVRLGPEGKRARSARVRAIAEGTRVVRIRRRAPADGDGSFAACVEIGANRKPLRSVRFGPLPDRNAGLRRGACRGANGHAISAIRHDIGAGAVISNRSADRGAYRDIPIGRTIAISGIGESAEGD